MTIMKSITPPWKIFRAICIAQLILVAFKGMQSVSGLFYKSTVLLNLVETVAYGLVFWFVYLGLSMLNYNYPDVPLSPKQKRAFNLLFLANFLLVAFLFAQIINTWWIVLFLASNGHFVKRSLAVMLTLELILAWAIFLIHLVFLAGMFNLRRLIHQNTISTWYQQFEKTEE